MGIIKNIPSGVNTGDETTNSVKTKLGASNTSTDGYLTSTNWNTFNGKLATNGNGANLTNINRGQLYQGTSTYIVLSSTKTPGANVATKIDNFTVNADASAGWDATTQIFTTPFAQHVLMFFKGSTAAANNKTLIIYRNGSQYQALPLNEVTGSVWAFPLYLSANATLEFYINESTSVAVTTEIRLFTLARF
jgi:hypothetical protein